jgi:hypothetical protein
MFMPVTLKLGNHYQLFSTYVNFRIQASDCIYTKLKQETSSEAN